VPLPPGPPFFQFADPAAARVALEAAGFIGVGSCVVDQRWENVRGPDDLLNVFLEGTARTRALLEGQTPGELTAIRDELARRYDALQQRGEDRPRSFDALQMPAAVHFGQKP
jgi:hypothetical protein